ncbi:hypothetical protein [Nocardia brasiliensis]|uniref:hypothetical protein n=1 Tax=Nocardia brasiliensis TaxID=37326 RepID=UPI002458A0BE|nr:hypothetical protein [Nocardia brasiliensis]
MLTQLADLDPGSREHACLREQIQRRCLPLADHIARRVATVRRRRSDLEQFAYAAIT